MLEFLTQQKWTSKHGTVTQVPAKIAYPKNLDEAGVRPAEGAWRLGCAALSTLVKAAEAAGVTLSPVGSAWSLSEVLRVPPKGWLLETSYLTEIPVIGMKADHLEPGSAFDPKLLVYAQAGNTVSRMHIELATRGLALPTSGASCGQTLAGAISTNTHGAAVRYGALPDMVRAVHAIVAGGESVWIEPVSRPVVSAAWCQAVGARLVREDDEVFAASVVAFGTMGLVHAYLLEVEPMYLLRGHCRRTTLKALYAGVTRVGDQFTADLSSEVLPEGTSNIVHFSVSIDPNAKGDACVADVLYSVGAAPAYTPHIDPTAPMIVGDDALLDVSRLMSGFGVLTNPIVKQQAAKLLDLQAPVGNPVRVGALCELFPRIQFPRGGNSTEIGVDMNDWPKAVKAVLKVIRARPRAFPGIVSLRFVRGSSQTLAFTRFPVTCTIELPIANDAATLPLFRAIWKALADAGIPHTLHWGQAAEFTAQRVEQGWGTDRVKRWKAARQKLLGPKGAATFCNAASKACGLT